MIKLRQLSVLGLVLATGLVSFPMLAHAKYPDRSMHVIVPWPAGRAADVNTRAFVGEMAKDLGQSMIVDNRPGASGIVGTEIAAKAKPDGYTIYTGVISSVAMVPYLYTDLPVDIPNAFSPVTQISITNVGMAVSNKLPVKNLKDLIALARKRSLNVATSGIGTNNYLYASWFASLTGAKFHYIPYNVTHWLPDLVAGRVDIAFGGVSAYLGAYKSGLVKVLAITGKKRSAALPNVPTFSEYGLGNYTPSAWGGLFVPKGTPHYIVERLAAAGAKAAKTPKLIHHYALDAGHPVGSSPAQFEAFVKSEQAKWKAVIKAAHVTLKLKL